MKQTRGNAANFSIKKHRFSIFQLFTRCYRAVNYQIRAYPQDTDRENPVRVETRFLLLRSNSYDKSDGRQP
jgi:hypothetical protein